MTMTSKPRVLLESDAGAMDTLIRRGDEAVAVLGQVDAKVQTTLAPAVQAAQQAAALATQRAGILGSVANDAGLPGKPAGDYRVGREIVSWSGSAVTARTGVLPTVDQVAQRVSTITELTSIAPEGETARMVMDAVRGGLFALALVSIAGTANGLTRYPVQGDATRVWQRVYTDGRIQLAWADVGANAIPTLNTALTLGNVEISPGIYPVTPTNDAGGWVEVPAGRTISGSGTLRMPDGYAASWRRLFRVDTVAGVHLGGFAVDAAGSRFGSNVPNGTQTDNRFIVEGANVTDFVCEGLRLQHGGVNAITVYGSSAKNVRLLYNTLTFSRRASGGDHDNSGIYCEAFDHAIIGNHVTALGSVTVTQAWGGIETHGGPGITSANTIRNYWTGINVVCHSTAAGSEANKLQVFGNTLSGGQLGIILWAIPGKPFSSVAVMSNAVELDHGLWASYNDYSIGIGCQYDPQAAPFTEVLKNVTVQGNTLTWAAYPGSGGIDGTKAAGIDLGSHWGVDGFSVLDNTLVNPPATALRVGRAGITVKNGRVAGNRIINPVQYAAHLQNVSQAQMAPMMFGGTVSDVDVEDNSITETGGNRVKGVAWLSGTFSRVRFWNNPLRGAGNPDFRWEYFGNLPAGVTRADPGEKVPSQALLYSPLVSNVGGVVSTISGVTILELGRTADTFSVRVACTVVGQTAGRTQIYIPPYAGWVVAAANGSCISNTTSQPVAISVGQLDVNAFVQLLDTTGHTLYLTLQYARA